MHLATYLVYNFLWIFIHLHKAGWSVYTAFCRAPIITRNYGYVKNRIMHADMCIPELFARFAITARDTSPNSTGISPLISSVHTWTEPSPSLNVESSSENPIVNPTGRLNYSQITRMKNNLHRVLPKSKKLVSLMRTGGEIGEKY